MLCPERLLLHHYHFHWSSSFFQLAVLEQKGHQIPFDSAAQGINLSILKDIPDQEISISHPIDFPNTSVGLETESEDSSYERVRNKIRSESGTSTYAEEKTEPSDEAKYDVKVHRRKESHRTIYEDRLRPEETESMDSGGGGGGDDGAPIRDQGSRSGGNRGSRERMGRRRDTSGRLHMFSFFSGPHVILFPSVCSFNHTPTSVLIRR